MKRPFNLFRAASLLVAGSAAAPAAGAQGAEPIRAETQPDSVRPVQEAAADSMVVAPLAEFSVPAKTIRDSLVHMARAQIGRRYRYGGTSPDGGFDCSGLVRYVMNALSIKLPRTANEQARAGEPVAEDPEVLRPGDLVTFGPDKKVSHIGIYVGEGRFVHASTKAGKVIESELGRPRSSLIRRWQGARRVVFTGDTLVVRPKL